MSEQDVETIRGAYSDFNSGNPGGVLERLDAEVAWIEPGGGNSPSGTFNGPQSVGEDVFSVIPQNFDEFSAEPDNYDDQGDTIVVKGKFTGKSKSGVDLDSPFTHTFEMRDGKIGKFDNQAGGNYAEAWS